MNTVVYLCYLQVRAIRDTPHRKENTSYRNEVATLATRICPSEPLITAQILPTFHKDLLEGLTMGVVESPGHWLTKHAQPLKHTSMLSHGHCTTESLTAWQMTYIDCVLTTGVHETMLSIYYDSHNHDTDSPKTVLLYHYTTVQLHCYATPQYCCPATLLFCYTILLHW